MALLFPSAKAAPLIGYNHKDEDGVGDHFSEKDSGGGKTPGRRGEGGLTSPPPTYGVDDADTKLDVERDPKDLAQQSSILLELWPSFS